jgi:hypothetical protein
MKWARHIAQKKCIRNVGRKSRKKNITRKTQAVGDCIILRWVLEKWRGAVWAGLNWLRIETSS